MEILVKDLEALPEVAAKILGFSDKKIILFKGDLGAGKTTLIKELCKQLGSKDAVSSPTFSLINHYKCENDEDLFHFDFYRLDSADEASNIGFEEYLESGSYCFIEWPDIVINLIFIDYLTVEIKAEDQSRLIKVYNNESIG